LSEKRGLYEKAKEEMTLSERILSELPGFRGYKEKEIRRETDKLIRNHVYQKLMQARKNVKDVFQQLSDRRLHEVLTEMDRLVMVFDRVAEKIHHASYGYAGFFDILKVQEEKLDKMIDFDSALIDHIQKILDEAKVFKEEAVKGQFKRVRQHIDKLRDFLESLEETFDGREEIIKGVKSSGSSN
jgi:ribosomal protein L20